MEGALFKQAHRKCGKITEITTTILRIVKFAKKSYKPAVSGSEINNATARRPPRQNGSHQFDLRIRRGNIRQRDSPESRCGFRRERWGYCFAVLPMETLPVGSVDDGDEPEPGNIAAAAVGSFNPTTVAAQTSALLPMSGKKPVKWTQNKSVKQMKKSIEQADERIRQVAEKRCKAIADKYESVLAKLRAEKTATQPLLSDLVAASNRNKRQPDKFSPALKEFSMKLYKISPKAYRFLLTEMPFPSVKLCVDLIRLEVLSRPADYVEPVTRKIQLTKEQKAVFRARYAENKFPKREGYDKIGKETGLNWHKVKKWFEKAREKENRRVRRLARGLSVDSADSTQSRGREETAEEPEESGEPVEKPKRSYLSAEQYAKLEIWYARNPYVRFEERAVIVQDIGCGLPKIKRWFANKRGKEKAERNGTPRYPKRKNAPGDDDGSGSEKS
ncbi:hypothetical protein BV898_14271 [Hypsibius exemplaris]|uniref:Homeobox domain-containing protein n=1 Tax=Hypsibius exemplaris TaxID=2072580 RepID=A0A1W0W857_HYPEX|nr:hypothetical protein BV898_14271 [Hypsibius exemplaris]